MLNRTNLTQTALLNGLNLGTRSLVLGTSLNTNGKALTDVIVRTVYPETSSRAPVC